MATHRALHFTFRATQQSGEPASTRTRQLFELLQIDAKELTSVGGAVLNKVRGRGKIDSVRGPQICNRVYLHPFQPPPSNRMHDNFRGHRLSQVFGMQRAKNSEAKVLITGPFCIDMRFSNHDAVS